MTVFVRTDLGQDEAYKTESVVPRKFRSILKLIDGRTSLRTFEQNLQSYGDINEIFQSLAEAGFIRVQPNDAQQVRINMNASLAERERQMEPSNTEDWMPTRSPYAERINPVSGVNGRLGGDPSFALSDLNTVPRLDTPAFALDDPQNPALRAVVDDMSSFVLTHMPDQSFLLLKEIEEITSIELLAVTLGGYEQMVSHLGPASDEHMKRIKQVLRENM